MTTVEARTDLAALGDDYWQAWLERQPVYATAIGDRRYDDRLPDESPAAVGAWRTQLDGFEQRLEALDAGADPVTHAALGEAIRTDRAFLDADLAAFNVDPMDGPQVDLLNIPTLQPVRTDEEASALLARWRAMPAYLDQAGANEPMR